ncbi:MAG: hypothetical protein EOL90_00880 [Spartobacteria bacterium]|nr:hypothetical protein [Spartobacteria bacterium]
MARRNRKNGEEGHRAMLWSFALLGVAAALAGIYLGLVNACDNLGRQIKTLEANRAELRKQVVNEERNWTMARSIGNMERLLAAHGLAMTFPQERNIIRLQATEPDQPAQYALRSAPPLRD